ncbi:MAG: hypothetical protein A2Y67_00480 [Candidatus Buchananbacteria bacterium RBG_13_39_9]|uniref:Transposase IS200-like domain-containing protein n=1 Tax=Candidatus Buchananbacteria bacterium RBG_13_39_9 TaxID=1797531 RepID=A0A1G1XPI3_9BACT|nr:MAG: hypothetical protein A2Y67_00480 [Candidatus Buchananbacteria bacterium RBG_13_39_9]
MRKIKFETGKFYHIYNRGVDKRDVYMDEGDFERFLKSLREFNRLDPIGSLVDLEEKRRLESNSLGIFETVPNKPECSKGIGSLTTSGSERIVDFIAYCLNPNHFHFILRQVVDEGISKFMHKLSLGYTCYFNLKNNRSGSLFQGKFKAVKIDSDEHLLWVTAYVNGNAQIHGLIPDAADYKWCSYPEYLGKRDLDICDKSVILDKFKDTESFKSASEECFRKMKEGKNLQKYILD